LGLPYAPAREPDLWSSIEKLGDVKTGTRLFVFLSGHGLYDPESGRLFLTQEAGGRAWTNLGMEPYLELFRSFRFARQFVFLDGCQNYPYPENARPTVKAAMHPGVAGYTPRPGNTLIACYAAGQDQLAVETDPQGPGGARGAMLRFLLDGLDLEHPCPEAVMLDFATGEQSVDLRRLFELCRATVERDALALSPPIQQTPVLEAVGPAGADRVLPIVRLPERPTARVRVGVSPAEAGPEVKTLRIFAEEPAQWDLRLPALPGERIALPVDSRLPVGLRGFAQCRIRPEADWDLVEDLQRFVVTAKEPAKDQAILFTLQELTRGPSLPLSLPLDFGSSDGDVVGREDEEAVFRDSDSGRRRKPSSPPRFPASPSTFRGSPRLRLLLPPGGAAALAGALQGSPALWVGDPAEAPAAPLWRQIPMAGQTLTLESLAGRREGLRVEPGPVRVLLDLPWGSWSSTVHALTEEVTVALPEAVGPTPLRVSLLEELRERGTALLGVEGPPPELALRTGLRAPPALRSAGQGRAVRVRGGAVWEILFPSEATALGAPGEIAIAEEVNGAFGLAILGGRSLAIDRSGGGLRVEPLSAVPEPAWDLLMSLGRLDALSAEDARELTYGKWEDWLLGLAGAYAIYAQPAAHSHQYLREVLTNLDRLGVRAPDLDLLWVALAGFGNPGPPGHEGDGDAAPIDLGRLRPWAEAGSVPLLRWGVPLALRLLAGVEEPALAGWRFSLTEIRRRLSPISTWTAWRGKTR